MNRNSMPALEGVAHRLIDVGGGLTIHVAGPGESIARTLR